MVTMVHIMVSVLSQVAEEEDDHIDVFSFVNYDTL